jgi:hypothetical protein
VGQILIGNGMVTEAAINELLVRHFTTCCARSSAGAGA